MASLDIGILVVIPCKSGWLEIRLTSRSEATLTNIFYLSTPSFSWNYYHGSQNASGIIRLIGT